MKKFRYVGRSNKNTNDCWNDALAYATNQSYEQIRKMFKHFYNKDGGLDNRFLSGYLEKKLGYKTLEFSYEYAYKVNEILQMIDCVHNHVIIRTTSSEASPVAHVFYVDKGVVKDFSETHYDPVNDRVIGIYIKERRKKVWHLLQFLR